MPSKGDTQVNSFIGGLVTEANPLSFPDGASLDEANMDLLRSGARQRRLGVDYEEDGVVHATGLTAEQLARARQNAFVWSNPSGSDKVEIGVIQIGTWLYFVNLYTLAPSANLLNGGVGLNSALVSSFTNDTLLFDFAIINNNLLVVSAGLESPFLLAYDDVNDVIHYDTARITIRDLYGVDDTLADDLRPTTLSNAHKYNLRNQGWNQNIVTTCGTDALDCTFTNLGVYPSNSDTWSLGKIADVTSADIDKYDPETLKRNSFSLGRAARGHYIIDLYNRGQSRELVSGIPSDKTDREVGRISTVATLGGRAFYSGIRSRVIGEDVSPKLAGAVLFSQIASSNFDLVKCYQEADPTSPDDSGIVDTDGGIIFITEATNIVEIKAIKGSIFVFAENGVWEIRGDEGGFRPTSFQVNKVSGIGVISRESIVEANGTIVFWAREGIFSITPDQFQTGFNTTNLSINTIQTVYNSIPDIHKSLVKGWYDTSQNRVRWLFNNESTEAVIGIPDAPPAVFTESNILSEATILGDKLDLVRLSDTDFVVVTGKGSSPNLQVGMILYRYDPSTKTVTEIVKQTKLTSLFQIFYVRALPVSATKFVLLTRSSAGGTQARFVDVADSGFTEGSPTTITTSASYTLQDAVPIDNDRAVLSTHRPSNPTEYYVLNYSTGSFVQSIAYKHASETPSNADKMGVLSSGGIYSTSQNWIRKLTVSSSDVITVGNGFNATSYIFTGGDQHIGEYGNNIIAANTNQMVVVTPTNPPTHVNNYSDTSEKLFGTFTNGGFNPRAFHSTSSGRYHINRIFDTADSRFRPYYQEITSGATELQLESQQRIFSSETYPNGTNGVGSIALSQGVIAIATTVAFSFELDTQVITLP